MEQEYIIKVIKHGVESKEQLDEIVVDLEKHINETKPELRVHISDLYEPNEEDVNGENNETETAEE